MDAFTALADPTRRRIIETLARGPQTSGTIASQFAITAPAISQHLKALRGAGLVRVRAEAQRRIYELNPEGLQNLESWLTDIKAFWGSRFDALENALRE